MKHFPVFLDLEHQKVLVVGGDETAAQKVRLMLKTVADIVVVGEQVTPELKELAYNGNIVWVPRSFETGDLENSRLVFVAGQSHQFSRTVSDLAQARNIPVNVVDRPEFCSFLTPAIVDRDPVTIAIGTEGTAPVLARRLKSRIEGLLPPRLGALAGFAQSLRPRVARELPEGIARRNFWDAVFFGKIRDAFFLKDTDTGNAVLERTISAELSENGKRREGRVALVGAGPGDPELLTLKAQRKLQEADVIVHDRLIGPAILDYARRDAERIDVGKTPGKRSPCQNDINQILIDQAAQGKTVVRLKGGDPYVFGRGGEEQEALEARGIPVEIVPGITSAAACAASIKLPLTTRGQNRSLTILTGTTSNGPADHDWKALAAPGQAFAIYMGVTNAGHLQQKLLNAQIAPRTPVVIVENGTLPNERCVSTSIQHLKRTIRAEHINGPAIIYVGLRWPNAQWTTAPQPLPAGEIIPFPTPVQQTFATEGPLKEFAR